MSKKRVAVTLRKPQTPAELESFVGGQADALPVSAAHETASDAAAVVQHGARQYRELTLYLPTEVVRELSLYCMDRNCDVSRVVAEAVRKYVAAAASERVANPPSSGWSGTLEAVVDHLRGRVSAIWALRN
jgi:hypothetical protein